MTTATKVNSLTEEQKAEAMKIVGAQLGKIERQHGEAIVRWVMNRRHEDRVERAKLKKEKAELERRLAEIG